MSIVYQKAAIIGVGLLGGSLGLALKERGLAGRIVGVGRRQSTLEKALEMGAVDAISANPAEAAAGADLVVVCTPPGLVVPTLDQIRTHIREDAIVTDVASTKHAICLHAAATWPAPRRFIGSHPMAGSEKFGPEHAKPNLYEGSVTFLEAAPGIADDVRSGARALWEAVGSRVAEVDTDLHDRNVARTSHVPHIAAAGLAYLAGTQPDIGPFVGRGFKDTTRIADGRPELWRDICLTNGPAIAEGLRELGRYLDNIAGAIEQEDRAELERFFDAGREARRRVLDS